MDNYNKTNQILKLLNVNTFKMVDFVKINKIVDLLTELKIKIEISMELKMEVSKINSCNNNN